MVEIKTEMVVADKEVTVIKQKAEAMQEMVDSTLVTDDKELSAVADIIKQVKTLGKEVRAKMETYTKPAQEIINEARADYLPYEKMCKDAESQLKYKANIYMTQIERARKEKEDRVAIKLEKGSIKEDTAIRQMENVGEEKKSVRTENSQIQRKTVQDIEVIDQELIPHEYWVVDLKKVKKVALAGIKIPGVKVIEKSQIAIR